MHPTLRVIRDEHGVLSAVLRSISLLLTECRRRQIQLDFTVLRAMLFYIDEFPEKVHHTKESELLFPKIRERSDEGAAVLDRLDADHAASHRAVLELEHDLLALEMMADAADADARRVAFEAKMHDYVTSYLEHMRLGQRATARRQQLLIAREDRRVRAGFPTSAAAALHRESSWPVQNERLWWLPAERCSIREEIRRYRHGKVS